MEIRSVAVIGAGIMGSGIAQVLATAGYPVTMMDTNDTLVGRGFDAIRKSLDRLVKAQKVEPTAAGQILDCISGTTELIEMASADYVIEAIPEDLALKQKTFSELDSICPTGVILASNTSQLSITAIASAVKRRDKVIGMHWFNPPPVMRLIEIVRGVDTSDETVAITRDLSIKAGKETVICKDSEGFITSRLIAVLLLEAMKMVDEGVASKEDIDKAVRLGLNHPMGPLELADFSGLDTVYHVGEGLELAFGERFKPPLALRSLVRAGYLGRKSGKGFYDYSVS